MMGVGGRESAGVGERESGRAGERESGGVGEIYNLTFVTCHFTLRLPDRLFNVKW